MTPSLLSFPNIVRKLKTTVNQWLSDAAQPIKTGTAVNLGLYLGGVVRVQPVPLPLKRGD